MKIILLIIVLAIGFGLAVGMGAAWWRYDSLPYGGPGGLPRDGQLEIDADAAVQPKITVDNVRHEFGKMFIGEDGTHDFVLRNNGDAPLEIREGRATCRCTGVKIEKPSIPPGRSGKVTVTWRSDQQIEDSREIAHATIHTNDPDRHNLKLIVLGRIIPAARAEPKELVFHSLSAGEPSSLEARLYGYVEKPLEISGIELADPRTTEQFETAVEPLSPEEVEQEPDARSGYLLRVTVKPGLPLGAFQQRIRIRTNLLAAPLVEVPVAGTIVGDIKIVPIGGDWDDATGTLTFGTFNSSEGKERRLLLVVRGPYRREVNFGQVQRVPEFIEVELAEKNETEASVTTPVTIRIPKDSPAANYLGGEQGELGEIMIETGHPQVPRVRIRLRFAVKGGL